jgi:uncharacterized protein
MTPQERVMLQDFLGKLTSVNNINKDPEADTLIHQALARQPDAGYVLVQNVLLMQHAITELNSRVQQLEQQSSNQVQQNSGSSFLGNENQGAVKSYFNRGAPQQNIQQGQPQQAYAQNQSSGMGDFLRSAGTTAAGVAGGMLLFEGISHMFSGPSAGFGGGSFLGGGAPMSETVINNYYGDSAPADDSFLSDNDISSSFDSGDVSDGGFDDGDVF